MPVEWSGWLSGEGFLAGLVGLIPHRFPVDPHTDWGQRLEMRVLSSETITGMMYLYLILSSVR